VEKRRRLVWSRAADSDLLSIWIYVAGEASDETADAQLERIDTLGKSLMFHPFRGPRA
jgi:plasmid stabilization system protein ParE